MSSFRRGLTLLETMIAGGLLLLLTAAMFVIYQRGASAFAKGEARSEMLAHLQNATVRLEQDLSRSVYGSLSITADATAFACLSPVDGEDPQQFESLSGRPVWRRYVVYWWDPGTNEVYRREVPLDAGSPEETTPGPIDNYGSGDPLAFYFNDGRVVARDVSAFAVRAPGPDQPVEAELEGQRRRYGSSGPETTRLRTTVLLRNN